MVIRLHKCARTTRAIREEIRNSPLGVRTLARLYGLNRATVRKWKQRASVEDRQHRPHELHATLTPAQETVVLAIRETLELPLDDLLVVPRVHLCGAQPLGAGPEKAVCAELSRSALARRKLERGHPRFPADCGKNFDSQDLRRIAARLAEAV
jgi:transposase-like protein